MGKKLIITEKPSVAREFAKAIGENTKQYDGYIESQNYIITWCVGHLVTMCYPDAYDEAYKKWSLDTIPFIPSEYKYEVIDNVRKQFEIIKRLFHREDVDVIYNAGDSGREGEYIQRLVKQEAGCNPNAIWKRVWIDSQTEDEIRRGINEAKDMTFYDNLSEAAYLRAKEDYLMGINFSRALTLKFGWPLKTFLGADKSVIAVGRVMTCVQGMVVNREREIRNFEKTPFYKLQAQFGYDGATYIGEWKRTEESSYKDTTRLYKDSGFLNEADAKAHIASLSEYDTAVIEKVEKSKVTKNPPLLYNLAELQNDCSKLFKISPADTLKIAQELYEKKMTTYPRTDARFLSTAVAKEITRNLRGIGDIAAMKPFVNEILEGDAVKKLAKSKYVNDKKITDHYAIIPTGQGLANYASLSVDAKKVYEIIVRRFLGIFYPAAIYQKITLETKLGTESFFSNYKTLASEGYLKVMHYSFATDKQSADKGVVSENGVAGKEMASEDELEQNADEKLEKLIGTMKKGISVKLIEISVKEGVKSPPKRYNSGSIILAMENAGQLIEDEELRAQIKGSGIGTSATRAEILSKLINNGYLALNKKTQIITPTLLGELIYEIVNGAIKPLLDPKLTASWEKGLTGVADGEISSDEYLRKLNDFVERRTNYVKKQWIDNSILDKKFEEVKKNY
ncbi:MAG: type IA DNA topoisomerase [Lachnospiraceae bacterium]|nr:type IA DNA topoisomerase [Candidatus Colinaster equi]